YTDTGNHVWGGARVGARPYLACCRASSLTLATGKSAASAGRHRRQCFPATTTSRNPSDDRNPTGQPDRLDPLRAAAERAVVHRRRRWAGARGVRRPSLLPVLAQTEP